MSCGGSGKNMLPRVLASGGETKMPILAMTLRNGTTSCLSNLLNAHFFLTRYHLHTRPRHSLIHKMRGEPLMALSLGLLPCALSLVRATWGLYTRSLRVMQVLKLHSIGWMMEDEAADSLSIDKYIAEHQEVTASLDTWLQVCDICEER